VRKTPPLPKLSPVELDGYALDLDYFFGKEYTEIGEASIELPAIIEWLNVQLQGQLELKHRTKAELERAEATAYFELKNGDYSRRGYGDKATEAGLDHAIKLDENVTHLADQLAVVTGWVERLSNLQRSLQFKLELVRTAEATHRGLIRQ